MFWLLYSIVRSAVTVIHWHFAWIKDNKQRENIWHYPKSRSLAFFTYTKHAKKGIWCREIVYSAQTTPLRGVAVKTVGKPSSLRTCWYENIRAPSSIRWVILDHFNQTAKTLQKLGVWRRKMIYVAQTTPLRGVAVNTVGKPQFLRTRWYENIGAPSSIRWLVLDHFNQMAKNMPKIGGVAPNNGL